MFKFSMHFHRVKKGLVTIGGFCYGNARYVVESVRSAIRCKHRKIEIILCDDGSPNDSDRNILREFAEEVGFPVKLLLHRNNEGLTQRLNEALAVAEGEFFWTIGDDIHEPGSLDIYHGHLSKDESLDAVFGVAQCYDETCTRPRARFYGHLDEKGEYPRRKSGDWLFKRLLNKNWISAPASMWRTASLLLDGGYETQFSFEDWPMLLKISKRQGSQFLFLGEILCRYRRLTKAAAEMSPAKQKWRRVLWLESFLCRLYFGDALNWEHRLIMYSQMITSWEKSKELRIGLLSHPLVRSWYPFSRHLLVYEGKLSMCFGLILARVEGKILKFL